jgi:hypothetical protein
MLTSIIRTAVRSALISKGPMTCSDLVRSLGMDPRRHKGTIHAVMVDMENDGIIDAIRLSNGKRDQWFIYPTAIRKRDRMVAALVG